MQALRTTIGATAALALWATAGAAQAQTVLKLSHFTPTTIGLHTQFMEPWARQLEACTGGAVTVEIYPAGTALGNIANQFDQVRAGVVDVAFGHTGIPRGRFPRTSLVDLPFVTGSADATSRALHELSTTLLADDYPGVHILAMMAHNPGTLHANSPINSMADLRGLRIRTPNPAISAVLEHYGAEAVGLPPGEQYENLQRGTIDGIASDWNGLGAYNLTEVLRYHYEIPLYTVGFFFAMNQRRYDSLPDPVRACVDQISGEPLVATFGPLWDEWGATARAIEEASPEDVIITATPEEIEAARAELAGVTEALMQGIRDAGVANADEILAALQNAIARHE